MKIGVCIPAFNEAAGITATLRALQAQSDRDFHVFVCDNTSSDATARVVTDFIAQQGLDWQLVTESQKGTGAAADTAMRAASANGCDILARTDADAIPAVDWVATIRRSFARGRAEMISGITIPIRTEVSLGYFWVLRFASLLASIFGTLRATNYGAGKRGIYVMTNGNNLAITATAYLAVGGFARTRIEELHEDRALVNAVRSAGLRVRRVRAMRVAVSSRRVKAWGLLNSLRWYRSHHRPTADVDIR